MSIVDCLLQKKEHLDFWEYKRVFNRMLNWIEEFIGYFWLNFFVQRNFIYNLSFKFPVIYFVEFFIFFVSTFSLYVLLFLIRLKLKLIFSFIKKKTQKNKKKENKFSFIQLLFCVLTCSSIFLISFFFSFQREKKANLIPLYSTMNEKWREKFTFLFCSKFDFKEQTKKRKKVLWVIWMRMLKIFWDVGCFCCRSNMLTSFRSL